MFVLMAHPGMCVGCENHTYAVYLHDRLCMGHVRLVYALQYSPAGSYASARRRGEQSGEASARFDTFERCDKDLSRGCDGDAHGVRARGGAVILMRGE